MDLLNGPTPELPACERTMPRRISAGKLWVQLYVCMNLYMPCSLRSLVLAVPTAGVNWQIGPCDRRSEWVGGTSALSNIKLMGRTIGASTALCMTAAKHCQMSLPCCMIAFKLKFQTSNRTSSDSQQPCPLWIIKGQAKMRLAKPTSLIQSYSHVANELLSLRKTPCKVHGYNILMLQQPTWILSRVWEQTRAVYISKLNIRR